MDPMRSSIRARRALSSIALAGLALGWLVGCLDSQGPCASCHTRRQRGLSSRTPYGPPRWFRTPGELRLRPEAAT